MRPPSAVSPSARERQVDVVAVVPALEFAPGVAMGEDVADLADRDDLASGARRALEEVAGQRRDGEVLAMGGAGEIGRRAPDEGAGDDAPDRQRIAQAPRDAADLVEPLQPERLLVRGDLEHRIGRGVADRLQRPQVLLAEFGDDLGARGVAIGRAPPAGCAFSDQRRGQRLREGGNGLREIAPGEVDRRARDLPMARRRILAPRGFDAVAPLARGRRAGESGRVDAARSAHGEAEAERVERGQAQRPGP